MAEIPIPRKRLKTEVGFPAEPSSDDSGRRVSKRQQELKELRTLACGLLSPEELLAGRKGGYGGAGGYGPSRSGLHLDTAKSFDFEECGHDGFDRGVEHEAGHCLVCVVTVLTLCTCLHPIKSASACPPVYLFVFLLVCCLAILLSSHVTIWPSSYPASHPSIRPSVHLHYTSMRLSILHLSVDLPCVEHIYLYSVSPCCKISLCQRRGKLRSASVQAVAARLEAGSKGPKAGGDWTSHAGGCGGRLDARHVLCPRVVLCMNLLRGQSESYLQQVKQKLSGTAKTSTAHVAHSKPDQPATSNVGTRLATQGHGGALSAW